MAWPGARAAGWAVSAAGVLVLASIGWHFACPDGCASPSRPPAERSGGAPLGRSEGFSLMGAAPAAGMGASTAQRSPEQVAHRLFTDGSLRDTSPDGDWGVDASGQLRPSITLRRRFDYYLTALGEASVEELGALVLAEATRAVGAEAAARIGEVWQRYVTLQQQTYEHQVKLGDRSTWAPALAERQLARRRILGPAWAEAFYREEEEALRREMSQAQQPAPESQQALLLGGAPGTDPEVLHRQRVQQFGEEAAQRLREEDAAWQRWEQRVAQAYGDVDRLRRAPELSPVQREAAIQAYLEQHFDEKERLRVQALLGL
nr:lipase secretion chaperone [uncultured Caldimonas sp.]